jgi:hypothetical protein
MKYLINTMQCNHYHNNCDGLMVGVFVSIIEVKGSNLTNGVFVINNGKWPNIILCSSLKQVPTWVDYIAYVLSLSFKPSMGNDTCH